MSLTMIDGGNKDPSKVPTRTKYGEVWSIGTINLYIEKYPEDEHYREVPIQEFIDELIINPKERVVDGNVCTGNFAVASSVCGTWWHGYTEDTYIADLILERLESRLGVMAERVREHMDLRFG